MKKKKVVFTHSAVEKVDSDLLLVDKDLSFWKNTNKEIEFFTEQNLFYKLYKIGVDGKTFNYMETGIGELHKKGKKLIFSREYCFEHSDQDCSDCEYTQVNKARHGKVPNIRLGSGEELFLTKFLPDNYKYILSSENSVFCSTDKFTPSPVELQNNTLLGRLDDQIQSIDQDELMKMIPPKSIAEIISNNKKTFDINSTNLNITNNKARISTPYVHLKYNEDIRPKKGYLRYNYEDNCFEGFDGKKWRAFYWEGNDEDT